VDVDREKAALLQAAQRKFVFKRIKSATQNPWLHPRGLIPDQPSRDPERRDMA